MTSIGSFERGVFVQQTLAVNKRCSCAGITPAVKSPNTLALATAASVQSSKACKTKRDEMSQTFLEFGVIAVIAVVVIVAALFEARARRLERRLSSPTGSCYSCKKPIAEMIHHRDGFGECLKCGIKLCSLCYKQHRRTVDGDRLAVGGPKLRPRCSAPHLWFFRYTLYPRTRQLAFIRDK